MWAGGERGGMTSEPHPRAQEFLDRVAQSPASHTRSPVDARATHRRTARPTGDPEPVDRVVDTVVRGDGHGIPVRLYIPAGDDPLPVLVWAHGGGWVLGDIDTEDPTGRALANAANCVVASVDYRLAPEHPFPAGLRDVSAVLEWAASEADDVGGDPDRLAVGGASAGGTLAAGSTLLARDRDGPSIGYQVLVYPVTSYSEEFPSYETYDGYFLSRAGLAWNDKQYLADPLHGYNPLAFPLEAGDLRDLPPATVVTAGFDMVRDEGEAYAERLEESGVAVTYRHYPDMVHTFFGKLQDPAWERAREAVEAVGGDLQAALGG